MGFLASDLTLHLWACCFACLSRSTTGVGGHAQRKVVFHAIDRDRDSV